VEPDIARALLVNDYKTPKVDGELCVRFASKRWSVREVPNVMIGQTLKVTYNPFDPASAYVLETDVYGHELLIEIPEVILDEHGFVEEASLIGREFKSQPDTRADTNRKLVERLATGSSTDEAAAAARKAKALPFGGAFNPDAHHADVPDATLLPRRGTDLATTLRTYVPAARILKGFELQAALVHLGLDITPEVAGVLTADYADGVAEDALHGLVERLTVRSGLRVVAGGGA
jgi:hypothetical protein